MEFRAEVDLCLWGGLRKASVPRALKNTLQVVGSSLGLVPGTLSLPAVSRVICSLCCLGMHLKIQGTSIHVALRVFGDGMSFPFFF